VGWALKAKAGKKKVVLELGGNAAVIVDRDADLEDAIDRIIFGAFYQSGQSCIGVQRILIHDDVYDDPARSAGRQDPHAGLRRSAGRKRLHRPHDRRGRSAPAGGLDRRGDQPRARPCCAAAARGRDAGGDAAGRRRIAG
jgi:hypothetical protein